MTTVHLRSFLFSMSLLLVTCASPSLGLFPPDPEESTKTIYLVRHGWHAGIVVNRSDIPVGTWPQHNEFPEAEYLEVGWGDKDYYMTLEPGLGIMLMAGLLPTDSVLHIVGVRGPITSYFPQNEILLVKLSEEGFLRLSRYIEDSYALDGAGLSQSLGPSLYGKGRFYLSRETYHAFNTCNAWTARALRNAGAPITPAINLRVETLMNNVAKFGTVIQAAPSE